MNEDSSPATTEEPLPAASSPIPIPARRFSWQRFGGKFLVISVLAHVLFLVVAGIFIVQRYIAPPKRTFLPSSRPNAATRSFEHKVQMKKQKTAMSAPPSAKRVTTTGLSKVSLPAMPAMSSMSSLAPASMSGMGAGGIAPGALGGGSMGGMGGGGGAGINFFGARTGGQGLTGTFYDLKQTMAKQPTGMDTKKFDKIIADFAKGGFNLGMLTQYFKAPKPIYALQLFTPKMDAKLGPAAFQMEKEVQPTMWLIHYKGTVSPPADGTYSFVGHGDDYLLVKFNGKLVLDGSWQDDVTPLKPRARYTYPLGKPSQGGIAKGEPMAVRASESYPIEIVIAEHGGRVMAGLLIEKEGMTYQKDAKGNPILPIFRLANSPPLPKGDFLPHEDGGPVWKSVQPKSSGSIFDR